MKFHKGDMEGKTAIVTGASGGIGLEFCRQLAEAGLNLVMVAIDDLPLHQAAESLNLKYGVQTYPLTLDLCDAHAAEAVVSFLDLHGLQPSVLINNAGIFSFNYLHDTNAGKIQAFIDLHVRAVTTLTLAVSRRMMETESEGYVLNMSSMSCWMPMPGIAMYSATKAYIRVFTRALAVELRPKKIYLMAACPGGIATDLFGLPENLKSLALRIGAIQKTEKFVAKALKHLFGRRQQYINGPVNRLSIFLLSLAPTWLRRQICTRLLDKGIRR